MLAPSFRKPSVAYYFKYVMCLWPYLVINVNSAARGYVTMACDILAVYTCSKVWSCHLASRHVNHTKITAGFLCMPSKDKLVPFFFHKACSFLLKTFLMNEKMKTRTGYKSCLQSVLRLYYKQGGYFKNRWLTQIDKKNLQTLLDKPERQSIIKTARGNQHLKRIN